MAAAGGGDDDGSAALAALQETLVALDARSPWRVCRKKLCRSDVNLGQARLLIPCARGDAGGALAESLTAREMDRVRVPLNHGYGLGGKGMEVPAFDRHGNSYQMRLKYMEHSSSKGYYRLCGVGWSRFVRDKQLEEAMAVANEMGRELELELWAFRSPELLPEGGAVADHHPDGALGMAILIRY
jgi:hypothetical protein